MRNKLIAAGLLSTAALLFPPANAQAGVSFSLGVRVHGHGDGRYAYDAGYERGYREGFRCGRDDARDHRGYGWYRHDAYRDGDRGYRGRFGPRGPYVNGYRGGFEVGYRESFGRFARERRDRW